MRQLREFAQHASEFEKLDTRVVGITADDVQKNRRVWEKATNRQFTILSDADTKVIRQYGLLHARGRSDGEDIALRTTLLVDENGVERWRRVSTSVMDIPKAAEVLARIREGQ